jgi:hypothetical protein
VKSELKKMKEAQEESELRHELENLTQVLGAIQDVRDARNKFHNCARAYQRKPWKRMRSSAPTCTA